MEEIENMIENKANPCLGNMLNTYTPNAPFSLYFGCNKPSQMQTIHGSCEPAALPNINQKPDYSHCEFH